jgi:adenosylcobinamide amidohydrolase
VGTINVLAVVSVPLTDGALVEAVALASEARTAALVPFAVPSVVSGQVASGTGTDCIAIACPPLGPGVQCYAGKHTEVGSAVGLSVREAVERATRKWLDEQVRKPGELAATLG